MRLFIALVMTALVAAAQEKKALEFRGTVTAVDAANHRLTVANEPLEGWMGAMTMGFAIDPASPVGAIRPGDRITAKVYAGDFTLHEVKVAPVAGLAVGGEAAQTPGLRLEDLERMALANNPTMAQADANVRVAQGKARQAGLYPNPTIGYYGDEIRGGYSRGGKQGGFVSQTIVTGGKLGAARRVAGFETGQMAAAGEIQRARIVNNLRSLYYRVLAAQRLVEVRRKLAALAGDAVETSRQLGNVGQADQPDILQAEVERDQASMNAQVAERNLDGAWRMLAAVAGKRDLPVSPLEGDLEALPDLDYEEWRGKTLRESPEVKRADQAVGRAEASLGAAKKALIPDLQVTGVLANNFEPLDAAGRQTGLQGGLQVGVQIPVFNRNQGNIGAAQGEIESARLNLARVKLRLERDLAGAWRDYDSARLTAAQYKTEMLPRARQAYDLYRANYQNMAGSYPQALISQRTLFQLETDYVHALETGWESAMAIQGFGLMDGLTEPLLH
jgi:cobalt-zinc-cadmium efflux system outer membrane protein